MATSPIDLSDGLEQKPQTIDLSDGLEAKDSAPTPSMRDQIDSSINDPSNVPDTGWRGQVEKFGQGAAQGLTYPLLHPLKTAGAMLEQTPPGMLYDAVTGRKNPGQQLGEAAIANPAGTLGQLAGGAAFSHVLPAMRPAIGAVGDAAGAIRDAAIGDPDAAALRGLGVQNGSKQALPAIRAVQKARPYLQGVQSVKDLQAAVPVAQDEIIAPYRQAVDALKNKTVQGPDGPTTIGDLDAERLQLSARLRTLKAGGPEAIQLAAQKGMTQAELLDRQKAVQGALYPHLEEAGINPREIMSRYSAVSQVGSKVAGKSTLNDSQNYGIGRATNLSIKTPLKAPGEVLSGVRDVIAGRPLWSGSPADIGVREAFRKAGPSPNLGQFTPQPVVGPAIPPQLQLQGSVPANVDNSAPVDSGSYPGRSPIVLPARTPSPLQLGSGAGNPEFIAPAASYPPLNQARATTSVSAGTPRPAQEAIPQRTINVSPQGQAAIQRPALPAPETHAFRQKAWLTEHPKGNLKAAIKQAQAKGFKVVD